MQSIAVSLGGRCKELLQARWGSSTAPRSTGGLDGSFSEPSLGSARCRGREGDPSRKREPCCCRRRRLLSPGGSQGPGLSRQDGGGAGREAAAHPGGGDSVCRRGTMDAGKARPHDLGREARAGWGLGTFPRPWAPGSGPQLCLDELGQLPEEKPARRERCAERLYAAPRDAQGRNPALREKTAIKQPPLLPRNEPETSRSAQPASPQRCLFPR